MSDFFKSAFGILGSGGGGTDNDFVGQNVELGEQKLRVKRVIAEGKFPDRTFIHVIEQHPHPCQFLNRVIFLIMTFSYRFQEVLHLCLLHKMVLLERNMHLRYVRTVLIFDNQEIKCQ